MLYHSAPKVEMVLRFHVEIWLLGGGIGVTTISVQNCRQVGPNSFRIFLDYGYVIIYLALYIVLENFIFMK